MTANIEETGERIQFRFSTTQTPRIAFVSCCGYYSRVVNNTLDTDIKSLQTLSKTSYDWMVHMGDQLYTDHLPYTSSHDFEKRARSLYRTVFGSHQLQSIFRRGAHIMVCDDHEFGDGVSVADAASERVQILRQLYLEYQEKLHSNVYMDCKVVEFHTRRLIIPNIKYSMLFRVPSGFLSQRFRNRIRTTLYNSRPGVLNVIVTSIPLLANNIVGSYLKSILDHRETDDSTYWGNVRQTRRLLDIIRTLPSHIKCHLVSGDLHHGLTTTVKYDDALVCSQTVTSGITNGCVLRPKERLFYSIAYRTFRNSMKLSRYTATIHNLKYSCNFGILPRNSDSVKLMGA